MPTVGARVPQSVQRKGYGLDNQDSIPGRRNYGMFFSLPPCSDQFWGPPSLSNGLKVKSCPCALTEHHAKKDY